MRIFSPLVWIDSKSLIIGFLFLDPIRHHHRAASSVWLSSSDGRTATEELYRQKQWFEFCCYIGYECKVLNEDKFFPRTSARKIFTRIKVSKTDEAYFSSGVFRRGNCKLKFICCCFECEARFINFFSGFIRFRVCIGLMTTISMRQKDIRPAPARIEFKGMKFLITDRPSDATIQSYLMVSLDLKMKVLNDDGFDLRRWANV